ncbi:unnamed protein product [Urochloa decumbens]|uniref:F-box protein AT5G49610-like beta-propeller domain-containing protein n=1 Tax=Urochloa decumbens TaxID=240449 RepID=A0ABC9FKB2_9POAL
MKAPAPALVDELAEEILLRFPADDPACHVRAALACKRSRRLVADPGFRRRFREFHGAPPVLVVFGNTISICSIGARRNIGGGGLVTYGFGGRARPSAVARFVPISSCLADASWRDPGPGEAGRWSEPAAHCAQQTDDRLKLEPSALVGNALYFMLQSRTKILKYSISSRETGVIHLPIVCSSERRIVLMAIEDGGGLGFATVRDSKLCLWSMEVGSDGDAGWAQRGVIDLKKLLPDSAFSSPLPDVVGFADGIGVIFLQTNDGVVTIDLKSSRVMRVPKISGGSSIFPYMSFYSPALGAPAASTGGDETGTSASSVSKA